MEIQQIREHLLNNIKTSDKDGEAKRYINALCNAAEQIITMGATSDGGFLVREGNYAMALNDVARMLHPCAHPNSVNNVCTDCDKKFETRS